MQRNSADQSRLHCPNLMSFSSHCCRPHLPSAEFTEPGIVLVTPNAVRNLLLYLSPHPTAFQGYNDWRALATSLQARHCWFSRGTDPRSLQHTWLGSVILPILDAMCASSCRFTETPVSTFALDIHPSHCFLYCGPTALLRCHSPVA